MEYTVLQDIRNYVEINAKSFIETSHGLEHLINVKRNAFKILKLYKFKEEVDRNLLEAACLLHDLPFFYHSDSVRTFFLEPYYIRRYIQENLDNFELNGEEIRVLKEAILKHPFAFPFKKLNRRGSIYTQIVQDADTLEGFRKSRISKTVKRYRFIDDFLLLMVNYGLNNMRSFLNLEESYNYFLTQQTDFIPFKVYNTDADEVVVLLTGYCNDLEMYSPLIQNIKNKRFILINYPMNRTYENRSFSVEELADYTQTILRKQNIKSYDLIGFSLGGLVAIELASRDSEAISSIIMLSSFPDMLDSSWKRTFFKHLFPLFNTSFFKLLYSRLNTSKIIRRVLNAPNLTESTVQLMKKNYKAIFGTLFKCISYEGMEKYKLLNISKEIHLWKDDTVLRYERTIRSARRHKVKFVTHSEGGHCSDKHCYFLNLCFSN